MSRVPYASSAFTCLSYVSRRIGTTRAPHTWPRAELVCAKTEGKKATVWFRFRFSLASKERSHRRDGTELFQCYAPALEPGSPRSRLQYRKGFRRSLTDLCDRPDDSVTHKCVVGFGRCWGRLEFARARTVKCER